MNDPETKHIHTWELIKSDFLRYLVTSESHASSPMAVLLLTQGFWASTIYRISHRITRIQSRLLRRCIQIPFYFVEKWIEIITSIRLPGECCIGRGLYIGHFGPIIVNSKVIIGDYCNLSQGVTLGIVQQGDRKGTPTIGNRVYIGPNSILIGNITVGNDCAVGAGSVVISSVPDRGVVAGNPARLISQKGSFGLVNYQGRENDPERNQSLLFRSLASCDDHESRSDFS